MSTAENIRVFDFFKVGRHVDMTGKALEFEARDLERICRNYLFQTPAPLVLGHPPSNGPSYGTVREIFHKQGSLYAVASCGQALINFVRDGLFKNRSASFTTGGEMLGYKLRHIGFLGAVPPAVRGLSALAFSEEYADRPGVVSFADSSSIPTEIQELDFPLKVPAGYLLDPKAIPYFRRTCQIHAGCPYLTFSEAASIAKRHI